MTGAHLRALSAAAAVVAVVGAEQQQFITHLKLPFLLLCRFVRTDQHWPI